MMAHLRIASPNDARIIHDIYDYYITRTVATYSEVNKSVEARAQEISSLLKDYPFLVAEDEKGTFLGFANAEPMRPQSGYRYSVELTIYLHPDAPRHSGVGSLLYEALLDCLEKQGYRSAYAVIDSENEESLALHRRFGFTELATFPNSAYKHGRWLSAVWMQKFLNSFDERPVPPIPFEIFARSWRP